MYASPRQINFVVPPAARMGVVEVEITAAGNPQTTTVEIADASPVLFAQAGLVLNATGSANGEANPAARGETVTVFATGLRGGAGPSNTGAMIGLARVENVAATEAPGLAGLWTLRIRIPESAAAGLSPLVIYSGGLGSNTLAVTIR
jgi:uncharacterized protein (TIGR03437 family)